MANSGKDGARALLGKCGYATGGWIKGAIKHPGSFSSAAKRAGMSTPAFAQKHRHDSGVLGKRARLAKTLGKMRG